MSEQGYFSLIQYAEHPERIEFVNVGVVLFSEAAPRIMVKVSESPRRVERVFGVSPGSEFRVLMQSIRDRIYHDFHQHWDKQRLDRFIALRSGKLRLSPPKAVHVLNPQKLIDELFEKLVGEPMMRQRKEKISSKLRREFSTIGVMGLLEKPEPIELPQGIIVKAPFAFQNGSYNLIKALSLRQSPEQALEVAGKYAIEGRWLFEETRCTRPSKLVIVGDAEGQKREFTEAVSKVMAEHDVLFHSMDNLLPLADEIRHAAKH